MGRTGNSLPKGLSNPAGMRREIHELFWANPERNFESVVKVPPSGSHFRDIHSQDQCPASCSCGTPYFFKTLFERGTNIELKPCFAFRGIHHLLNACRCGSRETEGNLILSGGGSQGLVRSSPCQIAHPHRCDSKWKLEFFLKNRLC